VEAPEMSDEDSEDQEYIDIAGFDDTDDSDGSEVGGSSRPSDRTIPALSSVKIVKRRRPVPIAQKAEGKGKHRADEDAVIQARYQNGSNSKNDQSLPESDLLKTIHYFASTYYTTRGVMFNRQQSVKKPREEAKSPGRRRRSNHVKNMVKALDGGVLVALGILVEEDIKHQLRPSQMPDDWEEIEQVGRAQYPVAGQEGLTDELESDDEPERLSNTEP